MLAPASQEGTLVHRAAIGGVGRVLLVSMMVSGCAGWPEVRESASPPTLAPEPNATSSPSVTVPWPTIAPSEASVPASLDGQDFAFWTHDPKVPCCGSTLRISTSGGGKEDIMDIPPTQMAPEFWSVPAGPARGRVLYVVDDGTTAHLMVKDAQNGADSELTSTDHVIARLAIDPSGSTGYYLLFNRQTSAFQGLWATRTDGGQPRRLAMVHPSPAVDATLVAERVYSPQLAISDDGSWIVFAICQQAECEFGVINREGISEHSDGSNLHAGDTIVGMTGDLLIGSTECPQARCDGFALDLRTGERWPLGGADQPFVPAQLIAGPRGPLVLAQSADHDRGLWEAEALDLTDGSRSPVFGATFEPGVADIRLAKNHYYPAGAELPPGWFLIYRNPNPEAVLPPEYSAAMAGAEVETALPFMKSSPP